MEYTGKLYGKVGSTHFPIVNTTEDFENLQKRVKYLEAENEKLKRITHCVCKPEETHGETSVMCCNHCGLPTEKFWIRNNE